MTRLKNSLGFSAVEELLIVVILGILGCTGWFVYHAQKVANKDYSTQVSTTTDPVDVYAGWKQYCSNGGGICFKYPINWQLNSTQTGDSNVGGLNIVAPSGQIEIVYNPFLSGIGGVCEPSNCFFQPSSITKPVNKNIGTLKVVKGIYTVKDGQIIVPEYYVADDNNIQKYKLSMGENTDVGFFVSGFSNPSTGNTEVMSVRDVRQNENSYSSPAVANVWFSKDEVVTAGRILSSVGFK